jgi:hypothetical protein
MFEKRNVLPKHETISVKNWNNNKKMTTSRFGISFIENAL